MAANRPSPVASKASAMPGATTASEVLPDMAISWNDRMIPQTVPKTPMKGAVAPVVARKLSPAVNRSASRVMATSIERSTRCCTPGMSAPSSRRDRCHSVMPATNTRSEAEPGRSATCSNSSSSGSPDQNAASNCAARRSDSR